MSEFYFDSEKHEYTLDGRIIPSVTQILADMGFIDSTWFTEYARQRGDFVHRIIKWYCNSVLDDDSVDSLLMPYLDAWIQFVKDSKFHSISVEIPVFSEPYQFAGTPDHVGLINDMKCVLDVKTGAIDTVVGLQLAGYRLLCGGISTHQRYALQLTNKGKYKLTQFKDRQDIEVFLSALSCWHWQKNHGRR